MSDVERVEVPSLQRGGGGYGGGAGGGITPETEGHWRAAADQVLTVPTCEDCGTQRWPLVPVCYACHSMRWTWGPVPGTGTVYSYTWIESLADAPRRNAAVIDLDGAQGGIVRLPGWVTDVGADELRCDLPVVAVFEIVAPGIGVPHWTPAP